MALFQSMKSDFPPDGTAATGSGGGEAALLVANTRRDAVPLDMSALDGWTAKESRVIDGAREYEAVATPKVLPGETVYLCRFLRQ